MKYFVNVFDLKMGGYTLSFFNDWVDWRWNHVFLELMGFTLLPKQYLRMGLCLSLGAVPLLGITFNLSMVAPSDTRGISLHLLGISLGLRWSPAAIKLYEEERKFYN